MGGEKIGESEPISAKELWLEAFNLAVAFVQGNGRDNEDNNLSGFKEIGDRLGGCTHDFNDLDALKRIARKAKRQIP